MPDVIAAKLDAPKPLVSLTDDEQLFRDNVRQFADEAVRPHVRKWTKKVSSNPA